MNISYFAFLEWLTKDYAIGQSSPNIFHGNILFHHSTVVLLYPQSSLSSFFIVRLWELGGAFDRMRIQAVYDCGWVPELTFLPISLIIYRNAWWDRRIHLSPCIELICPFSQNLSCGKIVKLTSRIVYSYLWDCSSFLSLLQARQIDRNGGWYSRHREKRNRWWKKSSHWRSNRLLC